MASRPYYGAIAFKGDGMREDSFARALCAAGALLGRPLDYATVSARLTNPFAPGIDTGEDCLAHWAVEGKLSDRLAEAVAAGVGLRARKLAVPELPGRDQAEQRGPARIAAARIIRQAMAAGEVVIAVDGWEVKGPHGFTHWAWSGIITEAREDGTLLGMHLNGHKDNPITDTDLFWAVSLASGPAADAESDLAMLRAAADRIRGRGAFARGNRSVYGLEAMDAWIARMQQDEGFCLPCQGRGKRGWADAQTNAQRMHSMARLVTDHLGKRKESFPTAARPEIQSIIRKYERIAELLRPALTGDGAEKFPQFIGDLEKQKAYARTVLMPIRKELGRAADGMEAALAAVQAIPGQVRPEALLQLVQRDYIGCQVPYLGAGVPLAIVAALNHNGTRIDFTEFAAATGWAFSFGYKYDDWRTASMAVCGRAGSDGPFEIFRWLPERLGYSFVGVAVRNQAAFVAFVKEHIDVGRPILSEHIDGGTVAGYRQNGDRFEVWFDGTVGRGWTERAKLDPTWVFVLNRTGEPMERKALLRGALARAVAKASPHEHGGAMQGLAALEAYRRDVADPARTFEKTSEWFCWSTFERLMARKCCAAWLASTAEELGEPARAPLLEAAGHYAKAFEAYRRYQAIVAEDEASGQWAQRIRHPEKIARMLVPLDEALAAERLGIEAMKRSLVR